MRNKPARIAAALAAASCVYLLVKIAANDAGPTYPYEDEAPFERDRAQDEPPDLVVSNSGRDTENADALWGEPTDGAALAPLPPMAWGEGRQPGSPLHPAVMLSLPAAVTGEQLAAAYHRAYEELDGMYGWMPLAETDTGWRDFVLAEHVTSTERVACGLDLRMAVQLEYDVGNALTLLRRGCAILQEELGGTLGPPLDDAVAERGARLRALVDEHGEIRLRFTHPDGFLFRDVHGAVRSLGLMRSDFGSYAWYNDQDVGHDRLIVVDPGIHPDTQEGQDDRTPEVGVSFHLAAVPLPEHVAERVWQVAATFERRLGVPPRLVPPGVYGNGPEVVPIDRATYRRRVETAIAALRREGWFRDVVVAEP